MSTTAKADSKIIGTLTCHKTKDPTPRLACLEQLCRACRHYQAHNLQHLYAFEREESDARTETESKRGRAQMEEDEETVGARSVITPSTHFSIEHDFDTIALRHQSVHTEDLGVWNHIYLLHHAHILRLEMMAGKRGNDVDSCSSLRRRRGKQSTKG